MSESFPRAAARTQRFTSGAPRTVDVVGGGARVLFVRSHGPRDRVGCLWTVDPDSGAERLVADPATLLGAAAEDLAPAERARRERQRESGAGITSYAVDRAGSLAAFALSGRLWVADLATGTAARELAVPGPVLDPRPDPTGRRVVYVSGGGLRVVGTDGSDDRAVAGPAAAEVTWGLAEFVAAEEMERFRGYWWAPDGDRLLVARVDNAPVQRWHIADPEHPERPPTVVAYPAAGTANAEVTAWLVDLDGTRREAGWDRATFPYLVAVSWTPYGPPLLHVMDRRQRRARALAVDVEAATTRVVREFDDPSWLDVVPGTPAWLPDGRLVHARDAEDTRRLCFDDDVVTPPGLQVGSVLDVSAAGVLISATDEPTESHLFQVGLDGGVTRLTEAPGVHAGRRGGDVVVLSAASLAWPGSRVTLRRGSGAQHVIGSRAQVPPLHADVTLLRTGPRALRTAVLLPHDRSAAAGPLPVLLDPYGGPHAQRVVAVHNAHLTSQWLADQGFAVVVTDGRGTPARGPSWERAIAGAALPDVVLADQVDALTDVAARQDELGVELDLGRVAMRGWSFGGWLSALAVLRRPDVFAAAIAGAPVTDWALYDTFYTERYLGLPDDGTGGYEAVNLVRDAPSLSRPLLIIHGLADDNVVAAHSLRLSSALLAAGRPHEFLPLSGVTHMTPQEAVAENLLLLQVDFLRRALRLDNLAVTR